MRLYLNRIFCLFLVVLMTSGILSAQETKKKEPDKKEVILSTLHPAPIDALPPMHIKLLTGYSHKAATDFEGNEVGEILKEDGVKIRYGIGLSQGHAVKLAAKNRYQWMKEQKIRGRTVKLALDKDNTLLITIPLDENSIWYAANFYGQINKPEDIVDMILMILSFEL